MIVFGQICLGESNPEAKAFLTSNLNSLASITKLERDNPFDSLSNVATNEANLDFYRQNVYKGVQKDVATVYNDKVEAVVTAFESLDSEKAQKVASTIATNTLTYFKDTSLTQISNDTLSVLYSIIEDIGTNGKKLGDFMGSDPNEIAKVYNMDTKDVETFRSVFLTESAIAIVTAPGGPLKKLLVKSFLRKQVKVLNQPLLKMQLK